MVVNTEIIVLDQLQPMTFPQVQIILGEDIFQTLVICVDFTMITKDVMSPDLQSMNNRCQLYIMS
jgi:hypothetical protein